MVSNAGALSGVASGSTCASRSCADVVWRSRVDRPTLAGGRLVALTLSSPLLTPLYAFTKETMAISTLLFASLTICLVWVTFHAWRLGNERRDVVLLGVFSGTMGAATAVSAIL